MFPEVCQYSDGLLQRLHGVTLLPFNKGVKEHNFPAVLNRKNHTHKHFSFFTQFIHAAIAFNGKVLVVWFFQSRAGDLREFDNMEKQLLPQLGVKAVNKGWDGGHLTRWLIGFNTSHEFTS